MTRMPALLFGCSSIQQALDALRSYEVVSTEPLHDLKNHIENLFEELPSILDTLPKQTFLSAKRLTIDRKDVKRGCDYRHALLVITDMMRGNCPDDIYDMLLTLCEISKIAYQRAYLRNNKTILRLFLITYKHRCLYTKYFEKTKKLTQRKMFGIYFHVLTEHFPETEKTTPLSSVHVESEERLFGAINAISQRTSSRKGPHIISNSIVRLQAEKMQRRQEQKQEDSLVSEAAHLLPKEKNTEFNSEWVQRSDFQYLLMRIADYLECGKGVWWTLNGTTVVFKDGHDEPDDHAEGPRLMHFYDTTFPEMQQEVSSAWSRCIDPERNIRLPIAKLKYYDASGALQCLRQFQPWFENDACYNTLDDDNQVEEEDNQLEEENEGEDIQLESLGCAVDFTVDVRDQAGESGYESMKLTSNGDTEADLSGCSPHQQLTDTSNGTECCNNSPRSTPSCDKPPRNGSNGDQSITDLPKGVANSDNSDNLSTAMAKHLLVAIPGEKKLIRQYDALLAYPKTDDYFEKEAKVQQRVLRKRATSSKALLNWEIKYFDSTQREPDKNAYIEGGMWATFLQRRMCTKLLEYWKISFE